MAKKNIISDFSALKGKVTFSEKTSDSKVSTKVTPAADPKPNESDMGLKIGQSVVMMNSNLRGRIIRLSKTVRIELEDGLVIEAAYGEFAVTYKDEIASLKETKVKAKKTIAASKQTTHTNPDSSLTIDLHIEARPGGRNIPKGQHQQFQMDTFRKIIRQNLSHKGMKITFVHGIGDGMLKSAI